MKIGLAGAGRIGARHAETLRDLPEVESVVIADADSARAHELAVRYRAQAVDSVDALFASGFDGLVVAAATDAHAGLVMRGAATGRPVFCEKPVAPDVVGTLQVIEAVTEAGVVAQIGFQRRFDVGHAAIRAAVQAGSLGWLHTLRSVHPRSRTATGRLHPRVRWAVPRLRRPRHRRHPLRDRQRDRAGDGGRREPGRGFLLGERRCRHRGRRC